LIQQFKRWAEVQYGLKERVLVTLAAGIIFLILIPSIILFIAPRIDIFLQFPRVKLGFYVQFIAVVFTIAVFLFALWTVYYQISVGKGSPIPKVATQRLLTKGPYAFCRNPMSFGTILFYFGFAITAESITALVFVFMFSALLLWYLKLVEEKELVERFGESYKQYQRNVPFLIPEIPREKQEKVG